MTISRQNAKRKGTRNEHRTMRRLELLGYSCTRAAASLGAWDVIAIGPDKIRLVQVKTNRWPGKIEMERLRSFRVPPNVAKEVWRWDDYAHSPKVKLL